MPKFNNHFYKNIYIAVNIFFLIAAPFNLGYYSYKLVQTLHTDEVTTVPPLVAGTNTTATKATDNQSSISDNTLIVTTGPELDVAAMDQQEIDEPRPKGIINVYFCIADSESGFWEINLDDNIIDRINYQQPQDNMNGGLLIYCQSKTRIRDMDSILKIKRITATGEREVVIDPDKLLGSSYLVLSFDTATKSINYEVRTERPE